MAYLIVFGIPIALICALIYCIAQSNQTERDAKNEYWRLSSEEQSKMSLQEYSDKRQYRTKEDVQADLQQPKIISCPACGKDVSERAAACPHCGQPIDTAIRCPHCGSKNVKPITGKGVSAAVWGVWAADKVTSHYECQSCHKKF